MFFKVRGVQKKNLPAGLCCVVCVCVCGGAAGGKGPQSEYKRPAGLHHPGYKEGGRRWAWKYNLVQNKSPE